MNYPSASMLLPRRSSFSRSLVIFTLFIFTSWFFIRNHGSTRSLHSGIYEVTAHYAIGVPAKNLTQLRETLLHRHLNQSASLEKFSKNITLLQVNMSGVNNSGVKSSGVNNSGVKSSGVNNSGVKSSGVNNSGVKSSGVNNSGVKSSGVNNSGVKSSGVNNSGVKSSGVNNSGVKSSGVNNSGVKSSGVNNSGVKSSGVNNSAVKSSGVNNNAVKSSGVNNSTMEANDSNTKIDGFHGEENITNITNPHNFHYILNTPNMCNNEKIFAIVYIHTAPSHYKRRIAIRQTWGNVLQYKDVNIRLIFVMGIVLEDKEAQKALEFESRQYQDIVQENFEDSYKNLTFKAIAALKWISNYCSHAKFVIKTDDDALVNMFILVRHLQSMDKHGKVNDKDWILGLVFYKMLVMRSGKMKVEKDQFEDEYYPVYCTGLAFTLTMNAALRMYEVSYYVPFVWVDDFYVTGLLPIKAGNITHKQFKSTYVLDEEKLEEYFTGPQWFKYIFGHVHNLNLMQSIWNRLVQRQHGNHQIKFALPGHLPHEQKIIPKEKEAEKKVIERQKTEQEAKKMKDQEAQNGNQEVKGTLEAITGSEKEVPNIVQNKSDKTK